jgi:hypothetical protein
MKVYFYSSDDKVPFSVLYNTFDNTFDSSWKFIIISNHEQYLKQFEQSKAQLMDVVGDEITDKAFFVPKEVKEVFLNWIKENENVDWSQKKVVSKPVMIEIIGEDKLNQFLKEMNVEEEWESVVKSVVKSNEPDSSKVKTQANSNKKF